jgi:outer membrane protein insertion porin family
VIAAGCAGSSPRLAAPPTARLASAGELADLEGERVVSVEISGERTVAVGPLLARLETRAGQLLDREVVAADLRRLWGAAAFADVSAEVRRSPRGVALTFAVVERPLIRTARFAGDAPPLGARRIAGLAGGLYEPARLHRMAERLETSYRRAGHRRVRVWTRVRPAGAGRVDVTVHASAGPRYLVGAIDFVCEGEGRGPRARSARRVGGTTRPEPEDNCLRRLDAARLRAALDTHDGAVNTAGAPYRDELLAEDLARIQGLYYDLGMIDVRLGPPEVAADERTHRLHVVVPVSEGPVYRLGRISLTGRLARQRRRHMAALGIRPGEPFSRARLWAGMARIQKLVAAAGGGEVSLIPETVVHLDRRTIDLTLSIAGEESP